MRRVLLFVAVLFSFTIPTTAQFYKAVLPSPAFSDSLNKIVASYRNNYYSLQGEAISQQEDVDVYVSNGSVPGGISASIYRFHSETDTGASLQVVMYKGESYKDAVRIYKNIFRFVNKTKLDTGSDNAVFSGEMEEPSEDLRFTSSHLGTNSKDQLYKNFIAEIEMVYNFTEWEVRLNLHSKKDDKEKFMQ